MLSCCEFEETDATIIMCARMIIDPVVALAAILLGGSFSSVIDITSNSGHASRI